MTQYMKEKSGADSRVEFQSGTTKKVIKPKPRPKSIGKPYTNQPIRKPAFADSKIADAVKRTKKSKTKTTTKQQTKIIKPKGTGTATVYNPFPVDKKKPTKGTFLPKSTQFSAIEKLAEKAKKAKAKTKARFQDAVYDPKKMPNYLKKRKQIKT